MDNYAEDDKEKKATRERYIQKIEKIGKTVENKSKSNLKKLEADLKNAKEEYKALTKEKISQIASNMENQQLITETFIELENELLEKINKLEFIIKKNKNEDKKVKTKKIKKAIDYFDEIIKSDRPDKVVLSEVLDKILIYHDKTVEFKLKISIDKLI